MLNTAEGTGFTFISSCRDSSCRNLLSVISFSGSQCCQEEKVKEKSRTELLSKKKRGEGAQLKGRYCVSAMHIYLYTEQSSLFGLLILSRWASLSRLLRSTTQRQPINKAQHGWLSPENETIFNKLINAVKLQLSPELTRQYVVILYYFSTLTFSIEYTLL